MKLENTNQVQLKSLYENDRMIIVTNLIPYSNSTKIKAYDSETGEPLGDIPENEISNYMGQASVVLALSQELNDDTGIFEYEIGTLI